WFDLFKPQPGVEPIGEQILERLQEAMRLLATADERLHDARLFSRIAGLTTGELKKWQRTVVRALAPESLLQHFIPVRWLSRRRIRRYLADLWQEPIDATIAAFRNAVALEVQIRPMRTILEEARSRLRIGQKLPAPLAALRHELDSLVQVLQPVRV